MRLIRNCLMRMTVKMNTFLMSVICLCFSSSLFASVNFYEVQLVYKKLINANGIVRPPPLILNSSSEVDAETGPNQIRIFQGMLETMRNDNDISLVLGHELAHFTNQDYLTVPAVWKEYRADMQGLKYLENAGYSHCSSIKFLKVMQAKLGSGCSIDHPCFKDRYNYLHKGCWL